MLSTRTTLSAAIESRCRILGVQAKCPFVLPGSFGEPVVFAALLPQFGSLSGVLVDVVVEPDFVASPTHVIAARAAGIPVSFVNPDSFSADASEFVDALSDWGFFGRIDELPETLRVANAFRGAL